MNQKKYQLEIWRFIKIISGLYCLALGIAMINRAEVGADPWTTLIQGYHHLWPLTLGQAGQLNGLLLIAINFIFAKIKPRLGTILTVILVGFFLDFSLQASFFLTLTNHGGHVWHAYLLLFSGLVVMAIGIGMYLQTDLGMGPVEGFMLTIKKLFNCQLATSRIIADGIALLLGFLLGGNVGLGTIFSVILLGPFLHFYFLISAKINIRSLAFSNLPRGKPRGF